MKSILFVDDEPRVLQGLERMLHAERRRWEMSFAVGGHAALAIMESKPIDIIVSDMRMPEMDGAQLLGIVRERFPSVVRLVLSGYFEVKSAVKASPVAHQFLAKPCDAEKLRMALERACSLSGVIRQESARRAVTAIGEVPCMPDTYTALVEALERQDMPMKDIAGIVQRDVGVSAKVLQLVNSAFFGLAQEMTSVYAAVGYLGLDVLKQLVLSVEVFRAFQPGHKLPDFSVSGLQDHSHATAAIIAGLPLSKHDAAVAPIAALLHDVGKLMLAARVPALYAEVLKSVREGARIDAAEEQIIGASHGQIGGYLLALWNIPLQVADAVSYHHAPGRLEREKPLFDIVGAVHVADYLAYELAPSSSAGPGSVELDLEYLEAAGVADRLDGWRKMAQEILRTGQNGHV